jgi:hypothetical protein
MFKRTITWLYERYCQEKDLEYTEEEKARLNKRFAQSRKIYSLFRDAGLYGLEKPAYPKISGEKMQPMAMRYLDDVYESAKLSMDNLREEYAPYLKDVSGIEWPKPEHEWRRDEVKP